MLKFLIQGGKYDKEIGKVVLVDLLLNFVNILYFVIKDYIFVWVMIFSLFVVVGLLELVDFEYVDSLRCILKKNKVVLQKVVKEEIVGQKVVKEGVVVELKFGKGGKVKKDKGERLVGNMGSKLFLEKLQR